MGACELAGGAGVHVYKCLFIVFFKEQELPRFLKKLARVAPFTPPHNTPLLPHDLRSAIRWGPSIASESHLFVVSTHGAQGKLAGQVWPRRGWFKRTDYSRLEEGGGDLISRFRRRQFYPYHSC
jgi:hypothetical protein